MQLRYMELNRQTGLPTGGYFEGKELQNGNSIYSWKHNGLIVVSFAIREEDNKDKSKDGFYLKIQFTWPFKS